MRLARVAALLAHPFTTGCDLDDPATTARRRAIIKAKPFLQKIYEEWYADIAAALPEGPGPVLELGSGAGFLRERVNNVLASDLLTVPELDLVADATALPFRAAALRGIVLVNVLHHVPDPETFFREAGRVVRVGGRVVMIEPWMTRWSGMVYRRLHHEPFDAAARTWSIPASGPLSGANGALPWIIFQRDRRRFESQCPEWAIESIDLRMPFRYLLSGGVSMRSLVPGASFRFWRWVEARLEPFAPHLAMFARIVLVRTAERPVGELP